MGKQIKRKWLYLGLPIIGTLFVLWYIRLATCDVLYSDYIRLINSYLPDVWDPKKFFVPDVLTRIPLNYLARGINVSLLGYSATFDMVLGALGLGAAAAVLGIYSARRGLGSLWFLILMIVFFSLNKWEMLTNGTGWIHFLAFGCFYYHYLVLDRVEAGEGEPGDKVRLRVLPFLITLGVAGPYCAIYCSVLLLANIFCMARRHRKSGKWDFGYAVDIICIFIPLLLYMWSASYAVEVHAGAVDGPILPAFLEDPVFFVKFFVKSFASMTFGGETLEAFLKSGAASGKSVYILGLLVMAAYGSALWINYKYRLHDRTILPLVLTAAGFMNHVLILLSRWIFMRDNYGMSSRYSLQFQVGILGILLTYGMVWKKLKPGLVKCYAGLWCILVVATNLYTTGQEVKKAPSRESWGLQVEELAVRYEEVGDEELKKWFQYRDAGLIRRALGTLKDNCWNMFK